MLLYFKSINNNTYNWSVKHNYVYSTATSSGQNWPHDGRLLTKNGSCSINKLVSDNL